MSKMRQACTNCGAGIRHGYPLGLDLFCSQGQPFPEKNKTMTCLEQFTQRSISHKRPNRRV